MKRVKLVNFTVISFALMLAAAPAFSQVAPDVWRSRVYQQEMLKIIGRGAVNRELLNKKRAANKSTAKSNAAKTLTANGPLSFKFSNQYVLPALAVEEMTGTAAEKKLFSDLLKGFIDTYQATAQRGGFAANDLAFAYTNFLFKISLFTRISNARLKISPQKTSRRIV